MPGVLSGRSGHAGSIIAQRSAKPDALRSPLLPQNQAGELVSRLSKWAGDERVAGCPARQPAQPLDDFGIFQWSLASFAQEMGGHLRLRNGRHDGLLSPRRRHKNQELNAAWPYGLRT